VSLLLRLFATSREYWMIFRGSSFLAVVGYAPPFLCDAGRAFWRERGWGSQIIRWRKSLVLYESFNTLRLHQNNAISYLMSCTFLQLENMRMQPKKNCQARSLIVSVPQEKECPQGRGAKKFKIVLHAQSWAQNRYSVTRYRYSCFGKYE
jgi:hypothetical protein